MPRSSLTTHGGVTQLVEYPVHTRPVTCSSQVAATRPVGQAVKTPPFHGGNMGSIPVRVTMKKALLLSGRSAFFVILQPHQRILDTYKVSINAIVGATIGRPQILQSKICSPLGENLVVSLREIRKTTFFVGRSRIAPTFKKRGLLQSERVCRFFAADPLFRSLSCRSQHRRWRK